MESLMEYLSVRGRPSELARALGITPGAVYQWRKVPVDRLIEIEKATGIPRAKLRPDLFEAA